MDIKNETKLFLCGAKRGELINRQNPYDAEDLVVLLEERYPYVNLKKDGILFFQNKRQRWLFQLMYFFNPSYSLLGKSVGYPPLACKVFQKHKGFIPQRIFVNYHGVIFATIIKNFNKDMRFLQRTMRIPLLLQTGVYVSFYFEEISMTDMYKYYTIPVDNSTTTQDLEKSQAMFRPSMVQSS